jgi:Erg28 like protein
VALVQFSGRNRTQTLAHVYGVKNIYTSLIRFYAAYHIGNQQVYDLAIYTFAGVLFLYLTEFGIWKTVGIKEVVLPLTTAGTGMIWMLLEKEFYVRS